MQIDGHTRLAAVVANPIKHSISPFIHNFAFDKTGINGVYVAWEIGKEDLADTVANIRRYDMWGINLSMPYKQAVIPYLDELTSSAELIGAVNTVINRDGKLLGHNTDGIGFFKSLEKQADFSVKGKSMAILGAGGAATAVIAQAALNGARLISVFTRQTSLNRTLDKVKRLSEKTGVTIEVYDLADQERLVTKLNHSDLLVNGTSLGMDGQGLPISQDVVFPMSLLVADLIYQPFETPFLKKARQAGLPTVNGLGMLLYQAAVAFEEWTGRPMPTDDIWTALEEKYK